ncbi:MAG: hypothetical protein ACLTG4_08470 [Oscillospiraceae bacterium]
MTDVDRLIFRFVPKLAEIQIQGRKFVRMLQLQGILLRHAGFFGRGNTQADHLHGDGEKYRQLYKEQKIQ